MTFWSRLRSWLDATLRRSRLESEMDAELRFHLEAFAQDLVRGGVPHQEAMRRARVEFGGIERVEKKSREARGLNFVESLLQNFRFPLRLVRTNPRFAGGCFVLPSPPAPPPPPRYS